MGKKSGSNKKTNKKIPSKSNIIKWLWRLFFIFIAVNVVVFLLMSSGLIGYLPRIDELENPIDKYASQVISSDDQLLFTYSKENENRILIDYNELSPHLVNALVATEDQRYYTHSGIDVIGLGRAIFKTVLLQDESSGGGSTISQQLAKQLYSPRASNKLQRMFQKPIEWLIAVKLERQYTKDEIINLYFNKYDFNYGGIGIESAARTYFNKRPIDLNIQEAAMLVGMLKNSARYNPIRREQLTKDRRDVVLAQMRKARHLTLREADSLQKLPIELDFNRVDHVTIPAPYYRQHLAKVMMAVKPERKNYASWQRQQFMEDSLSWLNDELYGWCNKNKKADGSNYNIYTDGLKIYSTIDSRMQKYAEQAVREHLQYLQPQFAAEIRGKKYAPYANSVANDVEKLLQTAMKQTDRYRILKREGWSDDKILSNFKDSPVEMKVFSWKGDIDTTMTPWDSIRYHKSYLRAGFMAVSPVTGHVKAYVGGPDFAHFKYDMVTTGKRQIGSTIKPYLYTLAMEEGLSPCDGMIHGPITIIAENGEPWSPKNTRGALGSFVTIKWGLQNSDNWVTAYLMSLFSPYAFARMLKSFGLKTPADPVVALALGTNDASVYEMAGAYTAFVNKVIRIEPLLVTRIEDSYGHVVANFVPKMQEIFSETTSYKMLDMLKAVVDAGTGNRLRRLYNLQGEMGGKTGTTNDNSDAWFMSFTPEIVASAWVGGEEPTIRFDRMMYGQGAAAALPIHGLFYQRVYADPKLKLTDNGRFDIPADFQPCYDGQRYSPDFYLNEDPIRQGEGIDDMFN
jgi:penicillin-binding protein 1A